MQAHNGPQRSVTKIYIKLLSHKHEQTTKHNWDATPLSNLVFYHLAATSPQTHKEVRRQEMRTPRKQKLSNSKTPFKANTRIQTRKMIESKQSRIR